jgi:hypothetical protein
MFEVLRGPKGKCLAIYLPNHSTFPPSLGCFLLCVAHQAMPPPSFSSWGSLFLRFLEFRVGGSYKYNFSAYLVKLQILHCGTFS